MHYCSAAIISSRIGTKNKKIGYFLTTSVHCMEGGLAELKNIWMFVSKIFRNEIRHTNVFICVAIHLKAEKASLLYPEIKRNVQTNYILDSAFFQDKIARFVYMRPIHGAPVEKCGCRFPFLKILENSIQMFENVTSMN